VTAPDVTAPDVTAPDVYRHSAGRRTDRHARQGEEQRNVAAAFALKTFLTKTLPPGFKLQILATQPYYTVSQKNCAPVKQAMSALVANIPNRRS